MPGGAKDLVKGAGLNAKLRLLGWAQLGKLWSKLTGTST